MKFTTLLLSVLFASSLRADFVKPNDLQTLDGLEVSVWATSPMFYNPTNMDVDKDGRIWVVEAVNYRMFKNKMKHQHLEGDRVVWMQDTKGTAKPTSRRCSCKIKTSWLR